MKYEVRAMLHGQQLGLILLETPEGYEPGFGPGYLIVDPMFGPWAALLAPAQAKPSRPYLPRFSVLYKPDPQHFQEASYLSFLRGPLTHQWIDLLPDYAVRHESTRLFRLTDCLEPSQRLQEQRVLSPHYSADPFPPTPAYQYHVHGVY